MNRTTCEAGSTAYGLPDESVTTIPGSRCSASMRAASSALESTVTTGKFLGHVLGVHISTSTHCVRGDPTSFGGGCPPKRSRCCRPDFPAHLNRNLPSHGRRLAAINAQDADEPSLGSVNAHPLRLLTRGSWSEAQRFAEILRKETVGGVLLARRRGRRPGVGELAVVGDLPKRCRNSRSDRSRCT